MDLTTRTARKRLKLGDSPRWQAIARGRGLGYRRRRADAPGRWYVRVRVDSTGTGSPYRTRVLGVADDLPNVAADGENILTFAQAIERAVGFDPYVDQRETPHQLITVRDVTEAYLDWAREHRSSWKEMDYTVKTHVLPELGDIPVEKLTTSRLAAWHAGVANKPARTRSPKGGKQRHRTADTKEQKRARRATANRVLTTLKAALNRAFEHDRLSCSDIAWRRVRPFKGVSKSRARYLDAVEIKRLLNAIDQQDFRLLVHAAIVSGCRYAELGRLRVADVHLGQGTLQIHQSKTGQARNVYLGDSGVALFEAIVAGSARDNLVLTNDGRPWGKSSQGARMRKACATASIDPPITFHGLRHTYASHYLMNGGGLPDLAEQLGHATTAMVDRHYGHLADAWRADRARKFAPKVQLTPVRNVRRMGASR